MKLVQSIDKILFKYYIICKCFHLIKEISSKSISVSFKLIDKVKSQASVNDEVRFFLQLFKGREILVCKSMNTFRNWFAF